MVKKLSIPAVLLAVTVSSYAGEAFEEFWADARKKNRADKSEASQRRVDGWRDARFGMFIHWDISSVAACEISWAKDFNEGGLGGSTTNKNPRPFDYDGWPEWALPSVPKVVYDNLHKSFYPGMFDAGRIVALAQQAGMKYIVQIAKHHGGFCMWDTKYTDYNIMATPFKRDIIGEMARACEKAGMKYGVYYSQRDWHQPDYDGANMAGYNAFMRDQIKELLTAYPTISIIWFDSWGWSADLWEAKALFKMIHEIRPDIIINERCGVPADFSCAEGGVGASDFDRDWESCITLTGFWAWHGFDKKVLPFEECLRNLVLCAAGNGNLLMNVGPLPTGQIDPREVAVLKQVGQWLEKNGESIYGTRGGPYLRQGHVASTRKGRSVYLHVSHWPENRITLQDLPVKVLSASLLEGGEVTLTRENGMLTFHVDPKDQHPPMTVVKLTMEGDAAAIEPLSLFQKEVHDEE